MTGGDAERPCIIVAGLGRCGSSLTMQMLHAAGVACLGRWPAFESNETVQATFCAYWLDRQANCAIKVLDPHRLPIGALPNHVVIWLSRNETEQAKSMLKFVSAEFPNIGKTRTARRAVANSIKRDTQPARAKFASLRGGRFYSLTFDDIITAPGIMAQRIAEFLAPFGYALDPERMAAVVRRRAPGCLAGMLEFDQIAESAHA